MKVVCSASIYVEYILLTLFRCVFSLCVSRINPFSKRGTKRIKKKRIKNIDFSLRYDKLKLAIGTWLKKRKFR